jgi:hypothetical protein
MARKERPKISEVIIQEVIIIVKPLYKFLSIRPLILAYSNNIHLYNLQPTLPTSILLYLYTFISSPKLPSIQTNISNKSLSNTAATLPNNSDRSSVALAHPIHLA